MITSTTILPTSRAIRTHILQLKSGNSFIPRYMTMSEFLQRALVVDGYTRVDDDTRTLLLLEAADFSAFAALQIERNFFTFTKNSTYLFRFFEELSGELIDIDTLDAADTYGDYAEHISILQELYLRYERICTERKILDPIFLAKQYKLNSAYVKSLIEVELVVEGYITNFEMKVLLFCANLIPFSLHFYANQFNRKMQNKFRDLGIEVNEDQEQIIDLNSLVIKEHSSFKSESKISCESFSERLLQIAFIKRQVYAFIADGIAPEKIAVILPDESLAAQLHHFDTEHNFNFAMGESLNESRFVKRLDAVTAYLDSPSVQNSARLNRYGANLLDGIRSIYKAQIETLDFREMIVSLIDTQKDVSVIEIIIEELFYFEKIMDVLRGSTLKSVLHLFVNRLKKRSIDDVRGGKITVMGLLESRAITYEGIIVVDFNENYVPRKNEKDLFLSSSIRIKSGLPSTQDREALQKLYYHNLFKRASRVAISYVESSDSVASRFLTQLGITTQNHYDDLQYADILFERKSRQPYKELEIEAAYDFTAKPLSATALKSFLTCKRKFYHHYVDRLKDHEIPKDMPDEHEIGTALHNALRDVYLQQNRFNDKSALKQAVVDALTEHGGSTELDAYLQKLWIRRLEPFFETEIARFKENEVFRCEENLSTLRNGIKLTGKIDRIDLTPDGLEVLDYKSGKYPLYTVRTLEKATDFQLEFYYLLVKQNDSVLSPESRIPNPEPQIAYYDLKSGQVVPEAVQAQKLELLDRHLDALAKTKQFVFSKTEDISACRYCEFVYLCGREL
ncbi:MAG: PD-(D/E)XK nuclease family protein [Epsilonproteobacteria bacterium]|nr:MAG: PD-(D/E)XK nuclease family protein [Campylobacterota bacterium]